MKEVKVEKDKILYDFTCMWKLKKKVQFIEAENRMVIPGGWGRWGDAGQRVMTLLYFVLHRITAQCRGQGRSSVRSCSL